MLRRVRLFLWLAVAVAAIAGLWLALNPPAPRDRETSMTTMAAIGAPFTLTGSDGQPFQSSTLRGKPYAIFFGFTHCPDVCPTTVARLVRLRQQAGAGDDAFAIVFVSVDPERDGPKEVGAYTALFGTPVIGLTGSAGQIEQVKKSFGVYSAKAPQPGGDYGVDHTATTFLMDRNGDFVATIAPDEGEAAALAKIKRLVG